MDIIDDKQLIYLAGPINGCTDAEANDWRTKAKQLLAPYETLDPMARDYRGREHERETIVEIVEGDKKDIDDSEVVLVYFEKPSVGTSMEVLYAWEDGKHVVVVNASGKTLSPWLVYHSDRQFDSLEEACGYIKDQLEPIEE